MKNRFDQTSYELHREHYSKVFDEKKLKSWSNNKTIDYWRHLRIYNNLDPLIDSYPDSTWLTVGDGRYGTDANYLLSRGLNQVLASDISDTYLKIAASDGFIKDYKAENAEKMGFKDNSFDFCLCKESYHHFPRPMVALYEMIRVVKQGVVLIEPQDENVYNTYKTNIEEILHLIKSNLMKSFRKLIGVSRPYPFGNYEPVGNYVYSISEREIEKVALGLNFDMIAFKGLNDYYLEGVEYEEAHESSKLFKEVKKNIKKSDRLVRQGRSKYDNLIAIIFKDEPSDNCQTKLKKKGFNLIKLTKNPYI